MEAESRRERERPIDLPASSPEESETEALDDQSRQQRHTEAVNATPAAETAGDEETLELDAHYTNSVLSGAPFSQGAEARLYRCRYLGREAVLKRRFVKTYRHPTLDAQLNKARLRAELRTIRKCQEVCGCDSS